MVPSEALCRGQAAVEAPEEAAGGLGLDGGSGGRGRSRWVDIAVGDPSEATFLKLYGRLPEAQQYVSDAYRVHEWLPRNRNAVSKGLEANRKQGLPLVSRDKLNRLHQRTRATASE